LPTGKLAKWFLSRDMADKAAAVQAIDTTQSDLAQLTALCEVLELEADEDILADILAMPEQLAQAQAAQIQETTAAPEVEEESYTSKPSYREDWSGRDLSGRSFEGEDFSNYNFAGANLLRCNFTSANLSGANFEGATLDNANFEGADLSDANLERVSIKDAHFSADTMMFGFVNKAINLQNANFSKATLKNVSFYGAYLANTNFSEAVLKDCDFSKAQMIGTNFSFASFLDRTGYNLKRNIKEFEERERVLKSGRELSDYHYMNYQGLQNYEGVKFTGVNWGE
jgi:uncharacterized protein YjbI with pentapeptide repeats